MHGTPRITPWFIPWLSKIAAWTCRLCLDQLTNKVLPWIPCVHMHGLYPSNATDMPIVGSVAYVTWHFSRTEIVCGVCHGVYSSWWRSRDTPWSVPWIVLWIHQVGVGMTYTINRNLYKAQNKGGGCPKQKQEITLGCRRETCNPWLSWWIHNRPHTHQ